MVRGRTPAGAPARGSTTVSSASGGARTSRHENASRPSREALPQRVRWSRMLTAVGVTPSAPAWRAMSRSIAALARGLSHASRTAAIDRRSAAATWTMISSSSAPPIRSTRDRRAPVRAGTNRRRWRSPRKRMTAPSRRPPRASSSARSRACRARWRRNHGSRSARKARTWRSGSTQPRRPGAGTVTTTPRSGWITTRRPRERGERRSVYVSGPPTSIATAAVSVTPAAPLGARSRARVTVTSAAGRVPPARPSRHHGGWPVAR